MIKSAEDPLTVNAPTLLVGFDVRDDSRSKVKGAVVNLVELSSIVVWDPERRLIVVAEIDFNLNA